MSTNDDLRLRVKRLLTGSHQVHDLDRLFLYLRENSFGRESVREIGDFIAHRDKRQKGFVTLIGRDVFTSFEVWSLGLRGKKPSANDIARVAWANFRLASDAQIEKGCGLQRGTVKGRLTSALAKIETGAVLNRQEVQVISFLGDRFIWKPAFTDEVLFTEFQEVLFLNSLIDESNATSLASVKTFLTLHAVSSMHNSVLVLEDGTEAELLAGFFNRQHCLEVKMQMRFDDAPKPIYAPICLFLTSLAPEAHCEEQLLKSKTVGPFPVGWSDPIEVGLTGKLLLVG